MVHSSGMFKLLKVLVKYEAGGGLFAPTVVLNLSDVYKSVFKLGNRITLNKMFL